MNVSAHLPFDRLGYHEHREIRRAAANQRPRVDMGVSGVRFKARRPPEKFLTELRRMGYVCMVAPEPGMVEVVRVDYWRDFELVVLGLEARVAEIAATGRKSRAAALAARAAALRARLADPFAATPAGAEPAAP